MSWWGGSNNNNNSTNNDSSASTHHHGGGGDDDDHERFSHSTNMSSSSSSSGMAELQQAGMALQQQMLIQQVINDLSDRAYEKCVTSKPSDTLTGTQVACVRATVNKWLDTNEFVTGRLAKKQQQAQHAAHQHSQF